MPWMLLTPREADQVAKATARGDNLKVLEEVRHGLNKLTGDLEISARVLTLVRMAHRQWRLGGEKAFKAVLEAAGRHGH